VYRHIGGYRPIRATINAILYMPQEVGTCVLLCCAYHEVTDDHGQQKERDADDAGAEHAVPHGLDPLAAQHADPRSTQT